MSLYKFKSNSVFYANKIINNVKLLLFEELISVDIIHTTENYLQIKYRNTDNSRYIISLLNKEKNIYSIDSNCKTITSYFVIPKSDIMRITVIEKCGYDSLLKSEVIDIVLFYKDISIRLFLHEETRATPSE